MEADPPVAPAAKPNVAAARPAVILPKGQGIAAYVPYSKKKREWIIASVETFFPETNEYLVKDQFPDGRKKMDSWMVRANEVIKFPADATDVYTPGERVLALWRMENGDWSSMFYEAVVTGGVTKEHDVDVRFEGDDQVHVCSRSRVVKLPPGVSDSTPSEPRRNPVGRPPKDPEKRRLQQLLEAEGASDEAWNAKRMKSSDPSASARNSTAQSSSSRLHHQHDSSPSNNSSGSGDDDASSSSSSSSSSSEVERPRVVVQPTGKRRGRPPNSSYINKDPSNNTNSNNPNNNSNSNNNGHAGSQLGGYGSSSQFPYPCGVIEKKKLKYQQLQAARLKQHHQQTT